MRGLTAIAKVRAVAGLPGAAAIACLLAAIAAGCASPEARHEVLTIFFTGVPEPGAVPDQVSALSPAERRQAMLKARRRAAFQPPALYSHGPNAANQCEVCHDAGGSKGPSRRIGPKLVAPVKELCIGCHSDKSAELAHSAGLAVHKPVEDGMCVLCHDPHTAKLQYLLKGDSPTGLCARCHAEGRSGGAPAAHAEDSGKDCLACHNAHVGATPRLLKADLDEWKQYERGGLAPR
jgi:predicted CXXCH cytochrome family protein